MTSKDCLGDRMKAYEKNYLNTFIGRTPVLIRIDGKKFSKYTAPLKSKSAEDPFHSPFSDCMRETMIYLCREIQNVQWGYVQSDEISLILKDWKELHSQQAFGGKQNKLESLGASLATGHFNWVKTELFANEMSAITKDFACFDARAFQMPISDVVNYFVWRQQDCIRNSVSMLAQHHFSHKELQGVNVKEMKQKLKLERNVIWEDLAPWKKHGTTYMKESGTINNDIFQERVNRDLYDGILNKVSDDDETE